MMSDPRAIGEAERTRANALQYGVVTAVDLPGARVRVLMAGLTSAWLPWLVGRAGGGLRLWSPPAVDEQVVIACPDGDPANGVVLGSIYQNAYPAPADSATLTHAAYADGAVIDYDSASHAARLRLPAGATLEIESPGGVQITSAAALEIQAQTVNVTATTLTLTAPTVSVVGAVTVTGALTVSGALSFGGGSGQVGTVHGDLKVNGDVQSNAISLATHTHTGVQSGSALSGPPQ